VNKNVGQTLSLVSNVSWSSAGQTLTVNSGSVDMAGYSLAVSALSLNGNTLTKNGGVLTVNGVVQATGSLFGGTVNP